MENYCAFSKNHKCIKWNDYIITKHELEEADSLCHANWIEIERKINTYSSYRLCSLHTTSLTRLNNHLYTFRGRVKK